MVVFSRIMRLPTLGFAVVLAAAGSPAFAQQVGVNSAVNPDATGTPPGTSTRQLVIGQEILHDERVDTGPNGQTQLLFLDESAMTVGPSSDVTIDNFVYNPNTGQGELAMSATRGVMRFVGGKLSKLENAVSLNTPVATIGIRGGVFLATVTPNGETAVTFLYGKGLTVTAAGVTQTITRPGFFVAVSGPGAAPSRPAPAPANAVANTLANFSGRRGASGGSSNPPTEASVANSGVANVISGNVAASVQQAAQNTVTTTTQTAAANPIPVQATQANQTLNTTASQAAAPIVQADTNPKASGTSIGPTTVAVSGLIKVVKAGSNTGFIDQSVNGRIPYSSGTISYQGLSSILALLGASGVTIPDSQLLTAIFGEIGTAAITVPNLGQTDFAPGQATLSGLFASPLLGTVPFPSTGTASNGATAIGTAFTSPDGDFFYANLLSTGASPSDVFVFGGTPVAPSFFLPSLTQQFLAFTIQPDGALGSGTSAQTIPFLPSNFGGILPNAVVSPLYVVRPKNGQFGAFNPVNNPTAPGTPYLQASLDITGAGASQSSALVVTTGGFSTDSTTGQVITSGAVRGTVFTSATSPLMRVSSSSHSVPDANNNSLFGGSSIDGFVIDQNESSATTGNFVLNTATAQTYLSGVGLSSTSYAFNQPVTATTLPTNIGVNRSALNETGYFGGAMQCCSTNTTTNAIINYGLTGNVSLQTDPSSNRLAATFSSNAPYVSTSPGGSSPLTFSGLNSLTLQFGSLPASGLNYGRSTFVDNNIFAAEESPDTSSAVSRQVNGSALVTNVPTLTSSANSNFAPQLALVTSSLVPSTSLLPSGVSFCQCQYSQWGYWTGEVESPNTTSGYSGGTTLDIASIDTWIAGTPTVTLPTTGVGAYSGAAVGTVYNNGAQYLAAGGFASSYNFAANTGRLTISNFDNNTFTGILAGSPGSSSYSGSLSGANLAGGASGTFYGPSAAETGGNFAVESESGAPYFASGIFDAASSTTASQPFVTYIAGLAKSTDGPDTTAGYINQSAAGRIPYSGGTITYPAGNALQGGTAAVTIGGTPISLSPLTPGSTNSVAATTPSGAISGTATMTPDGDFFFANLAFPGGANAQQEFVFGGVPVNQNFYQSNPSQQILTFNLQPDAALANGSQTQTIPFLPSNFGGTMANASVSNLYIGVGANSPFGLANSSLNGYASPKILQASLAFNGQGASQTSALVVATGDFFTNSTGEVAAAGPVRGTVTLNASASPMRILSGLATVPDGNGNNLFGGSTLSGFVLDSNQYNFSGAFVPNSSAGTFQFTPGGSVATNYAFNQPATATPLPANATGTQQALNESGYFGGIMTHGSQTVSTNQYVLTGNAFIQSTVTNNRVAAQFFGNDPFTAAQSGINSVGLQFGDNTSGTNSSRGTYINNNVYAATDSPITPSTINGNALPLPPNSTSANPSPSIAMVTSGTVPNAINGILPAGVTPCACQYLQWGYWTGSIPSNATQGLGVSRLDQAGINTWIAGQPTVTMPTSGTGTFNGAAVGTVFNNGATYVAAGGFNNTYNFGTNSGTVSITNFDGANYAAAVGGGGNTYSGTLTGTPNRSGSVNGSFFGPNAIETGGVFNIQSTAGVKYLASGIFAGR